MKKIMYSHKFVKFIETLNYRDEIIEAYQSSPIDN